MILKRLGWTTVLAVVLLVLLAAPAVAFTDVSGSHPNYEAINSMAEWGIVEGWGDDTFRPDDGVKRAQFAKMAAGMLNIEVTEGMTSPFTDLGTNDATLYPHEFVAAAYKHGITKGVTASTYNPWAYITRAQATTMSVRAMQNLYPGELDPTIYDFYSPWGQFSPDHWQSAAIANRNDLYSGLPSYEQLSPWDRMPREEVAQLLYNLMEYLPPKQLETTWSGSHLADGLRVTAEVPTEVAGRMAAPTGMKYLASMVIVKNEGVTAKSVWGNGDFFMLTPDGVKLDDTAGWAVDGALGYTEQLAPGTSVQGYVVFEVPTSTTMAALIYDADPYDYSDYLWR